MCRRRWLIHSFTLLTPLLALAAGDALISLALLIGDGRFAGVAVPPYDLLFNDSQARALTAETEDPYFQFDAELGWSIRPNGESSDGRFQANGAGFRADHEYTRVPPEGITRVGVFGDSFTHGDKVANGDTWAQQLESGVPGVEVLNFGVNAYGTDQALLRFRRDGADYGLHIVLIGFIPENLLRNVSVYRPAYQHYSGGIGVKPRFHLDESGELVLIPLPVKSRAELVARIRDRSLVPTLLETDYWVRRASLAYTGSPIFVSSLARILYGCWERAGRARARYYGHADSEPCRITRAILRAFAADARERGARRVAVLLLPDELSIHSLLRGEVPLWTPLTVALAEDGIEVIDLTADLLAALEHGRAESLFSEYHYTPRANAVVAGALSRVLFCEESP